MKPKEQTLSDKSLPDKLWNRIYQEKDVKDFIKKLKERINLTLISNKIKWDLNDDIDELAGDKLIEEKKK